MIQDLNFITFDKQISTGLVLVDYWAEWCAPCLSQNPLLQEIARDVSGIAIIAKVNIADNRVIADQQKVKNIPTLILYKDGIEIKRFAGIQSKEIIIKTIEQNNI